MVFQVYVCEVNICLEQCQRQNVCKEDVTEGKKLARKGLKIPLSYIPSSMEVAVP